MIKLINNASRDLGLSARQSVILPQGGSKSVSAEQFAELRQSSKTRQWIESGVITVEQEGAEPATDILDDYVDTEDDPEIPDRGIHLESQGGGWWHVYVNGHQVTDKAVRKTEAEEIADEYK